MSTAGLMNWTGTAPKVTRLVKHVVPERVRVRARDTRRESVCGGEKDSRLDELNGHGAEMHETVKHEVPEHVRVRV